MGLTFDTGALINLEHRRLDMRKVVEVAAKHGVPITVPTVVVAEWWRSGRGFRERVGILRMFVVEPLGEQVAKMAGHALGTVRGAATVDAIVVASAALRGDVIYTSDVADLEALSAGCFPGVRIERA